MTARPPCRLGLSLRPDIARGLFVTVAFDTVTADTR